MKDGRFWGKGPIIQKQIRQNILLLSYGSAHLCCAQTVARSWDMAVTSINANYFPGGYITELQNEVKTLARHTLLLSTGLGLYFPPRAAAQQVMKEA